MCKNNSSCGSRSNKVRGGHQLKYWKPGTRKAVNLTLSCVSISTQKINRLSDCTSLFYRFIYIFHCDLKHSKCLHFSDQEQTCIPLRLKFRPHLKGNIAVALRKLFLCLPTYKFGEFKRTALFILKITCQKRAQLNLYILQFDYNKYIQWIYF